MVGIVPVHNHGIKDYLFPLHPSLIPVSEELTAIERSVLECAWAGCKMIFVVINDDVSQILRKRIGVVLRDPVDVAKNYFFNDPSVEMYYNKIKDIGVFYVPINPRDQRARGSYAWSAVYGALVASKTLKNVAYYYKPDRYYFSFPFGVTGFGGLYRHRENFRNGQNIYFSHEGKTVKDNLPLSLTVNEEDLEILRTYIYRGEYWKDGISGISNKENIQNLRLAKFYTLGQVFSKLDFSNSKEVDVPFFHDISTWQGYVEMFRDPLYDTNKLKKDHIKMPGTDYTFYWKDEKNDKIC